MPFTFEGSHAEIERIETGLYSLDVALRKNYKEIGWPTRTLTEVYGPTSTGKSTFINSVSCLLATKQGLGIACLDLETQDPNTIETIANNLGYEGVWKWVEPNKQKQTVEDTYLLGLLRKEISKGNIAILDSVASIVPVSENTGDIGDANMGKRAFPMAQFSRLTNRELKWAEKGNFAFLANHRYEKFDVGRGLQFAKQYAAPGGVVKENMAHIIIENKFAWHESLKKLHYGDSWVFEGKVKKNRFGLSNSVFWVFVVGGQGVHLGLTSMFDCVLLGLAKIASGKKIVIASTGEELGRVSDIIKNRNDYNFKVFQKELAAHKLNAEDDSTEPEDDELDYTQEEA